MADVVIKLKDDTLYKVETKGQSVEVRDYAIYKYGLPIEDGVYSINHLNLVKCGNFLLI